MPTTVHEYPAGSVAHGDVVGYRRPTEPDVLFRRVVSATSASHFCTDENRWRLRSTVVLASHPRRHRGTAAHTDALVVWADESVPVLAEAS